MFAVFVIFLSELHPLRAPEPSLWKHHPSPHRSADDTDSILYTTPLGATHSGPLGEEYIHVRSVYTPQSARIGEACFGYICKFVKDNIGSPFPEHRWCQYIEL